MKEKEEARPDPDRHVSIQLPASRNHANSTADALTSAGGPGIDRRRWLVRFGRRAILGGISILSASLLVRWFNAGCIGSQSPCQTCRAFAHCGLPRAEENRKPESDRRMS